MPTRRISMDMAEAPPRTRYACGRSQREIAPAVNQLLQRATLAWPLGRAGLRGDATSVELLDEPDIAAAVAAVPRGTPDYYG